MCFPRSGDPAAPITAFLHMKLPWPLVRHSTAAPKPFIHACMSSSPSHFLVSSIQAFMYSSSRNDAASFYVNGGCASRYTTAQIPIPPSRSSSPSTQHLPSSRALLFRIYALPSVCSCMHDPLPIVLMSQYLDLTFHCHFCAA